MTFSVIGKGHAPSSEGPQFHGPLAIGKRPPHLGVSMPAFLGQDFLPGFLSHPMGF